MSIRDRISGLLNRQPTNQAQPQKSIDSFSSWVNYSNAFGSAGELSDDTYALVLAATTVVAVSRGLSFWETTIGGLEWNIKQLQGDKEVIIASSRDRRPKHKFHAALIRHNHRYYRDLIPLVVMSDKLHGETYVERIVNKEQIDGELIGSDLRWLNPIAMQLNDIDRDGTIDEFIYSPASGERVQFTPAEIAYRIYGINPGDDLRGLGVVQPALSAINIDRNLKRSISAFFRNYALPAAMISPIADMAHLSPKEVEKLELFFRDFAKGVDNQHSVTVAPVKSQVDTFDQPDIDKQYSLHEPLVREIFLSMGVPPAIAGDPSMSKFHDGVPVFENWWGATGIPYAHDLERYITGQLVTFLDPGSDSWFEFDLSAFDQINEQDEIASRVLASDVNTGYLTLNEARVERGFESDPALENLFMVGGVLTPRHELLALKDKPVLEPSAIVETPDSQLLQTETKSIETWPTKALVELKHWKKVHKAKKSRAFVPEHTLGDIADSIQKAIDREADKSAFAYIPLSNQPDIVSAVRQLKEQLSDERIEWQAAPTYHITLCYAGIMTDTAIEKVSTLIHLEGVEIQAVQGDFVNTFDTPDGQALHIRILNTSVLGAIQANVYSAFETEAHDLSDFSDPSQWIPHITLAYIPNDIKVNIAELNEAIEWLDDVLIPSDTVTIGRDDYEPSLILTAPQHIKIMKSEINDSVDAAFDSAFTLLRQPGLKALEAAFISLCVSLATNDAEGALKSLQSIRLDFEGDFENVISAIRSGGLDDRGRAGRQLRQILRTFGARLFRQGLTDAGVLDDPTDEEQATIQDLIRGNSKFIGNLTKVLITGDGITDVQAAGKAAMWFNRSMIGFYYEGFESGARNQMMEFGGPAGKKPGITCARLDGQRHRMKDWKRKQLRPKVDGHNFECGGHNCRHTLKPVAAKAKGTW